MMLRRGRIGYAAAFVPGVSVLYGVMVAGVPVPLVGVVRHSSYERTVVQAVPGSTVARINSLLEQG